MIVFIKLYKKIIGILANVSDIAQQKLLDYCPQYGAEGVQSIKQPGK